MEYRATRQQYRAEEAEETEKQDEVLLSGCRESGVMPKAQLARPSRGGAVNGSPTRHSSR